MPSEATYARLAQQAYKSRGGHPPAGWKVINIQEYNSYQLVAYKNEQTHEVVIAVPGTDVTKPETLLNDLQIVLKETLDYENFVMKFTEQTERSLQSQGDRNYKLSYTGHSLGGYLAQLAALRTHRAAVVFESPGVFDVVERNADKYYLINPDIRIINTIPNPVNAVNRQIVKPKYIQVKPTQRLSHMVSKLFICLATLGLAAYSSDKIQSGWDNLSSATKLSIKQGATFTISGLLTWAINGLISHDNPLSTGIRWIDIASTLGHFHSIDNIVDAYEHYQGQPILENVDYNDVETMHTMMQKFLYHTSSGEFDYQDLKELSYLFERYGQRNPLLDSAQELESIPRLAAPAA